MQLNVFRDPSTILLTVVITLLAVVTKLVGGGAGALHLGWRRAAQVGVGMVPRGEVGIVVAQIGLGLAVITDSLFAVVLFMAVATTLIAPPFPQIVVCIRLDEAFLTRPQLLSLISTARLIFLAEDLQH